MKILFVAQNFQMGGIQKALINMLKEISPYEKYEIDIFTFSGGELMNDIPSNVKVTTGNLLLQLIATPFAEVKKRNNVWHIILRIVCMIVVRLIGSHNFYSMLLKKHRNNCHYDIAISYFNDVPNQYFNKGTNLFVDQFVIANRKLAWIHTDPIKANFNYEACVKTYKNFDRLLCVSVACKENLINFLPEYQHKIQVVYNFFPIEEIKELACQYTPFHKSELDLISVGRIENSTKRFDLIPHLCKLLKETSINNFRWRILGDGPDLLSNQQLALQLGVEDVVEFVGEMKNPYPFIKCSDVFVLTSAYEGYPMVIGEALIVQTPVITTDFAAAGEQICNGHNGLITGFNIQDIFQVISSVMKNTELLHNMKNYIEENHYTNKKAQEQLVLEFDVHDRI
ncbi:group 1 glycosyl transferase [Lysinibacillus capsici]|uniref:Group 1 glycosyl transferase n=1 Tax=Lysinibacillus capsici TaxID=2115968 RepID=A0A2X0YX73_9BACI|nr:glycosyltransferase [Lysinibacillus capsici]SPT99937.1 group 1 glycosyl transferase [Lysinibacillus capsici]